MVDHSPKIPVSKKKSQKGKKKKSEGCLYNNHGRVDTHEVLCVSFQATYGKVIAAHNHYTSTDNIKIAAIMMEFLFTSWYFEPSQPLWIISGLKTNFYPSLSYSAHKSFKTNHNISTAQLKYFHI